MIVGLAIVVVSAVNSGGPCTQTNSATKAKASDDSIQGGSWRRIQYQRGHLESCVGVNGASACNLWFCKAVFDEGDAGGRLQLTTKR